MHGPNVFCQHHYEIAAANSSPCPAPSMQTPNNYLNSYHTPPFPSPHGDYHSSPVMSQLPPTNPNALPPQPPPNASPCAMEHSSKVQSYFNGAPTARQKGRPRKRKPKDLEGMTANLGMFIYIIYF
jgi:LIM homeobox protein 2/9